MLIVHITQAPIMSYSAQACHVMSISGAERSYNAHLS